MDDDVDGGDDSFNPLRTHSHIFSDGFVVTNVHATPRHIV